MRVGLDVTGLFWKYRTGVQNYYYGLLEGLAQLNNADECVLIDRSEDAHFFPFELGTQMKMRRALPAHLPTFDSLTSMPVFGGSIRSWNHGVRSLARRAANRPWALDRLLSDLDVFHVWTWNICQAPNAKHVITLTDAIPIIFADLFTPEFVTSTQIGLDFARTRATQVIAISNFTKREIMRVANIPESRINIIYPGIRAIFKPLASERVAAVRARYGIGDNPYVLSVGYLDPRKNVQGHVRAFAMLATGKMFRDFHLVLVGPESFASSQVWAEIRSTDVCDRIHVTGFTSDEDVVALMNGASAFLYCSLYEGFGFPVLEAMACGVPVITSNSTSLPEISGNAALLVDPNNYAEIAAAMAQVLTNSALRDMLKERGLERARQFTWERSAREHSRVYHDVYQADD